VGQQVLGRRQAAICCCGQKRRYRDACGSIATIQRRDPHACINHADFSCTMLLDCTRLAVMVYTKSVCAWPRFEHVVLGKMSCTPHHACFISHQCSSLVAIIIPLICWSCCQALASSDAASCGNSAMLVISCFQNF
jgi:hypothetical protein